MEHGKRSLIRPPAPVNTNRSACSQERGSQRITLMAVWLILQNLHAWNLPEFAVGGRGNDIGRRCHGRRASLARARVPAKCAGLRPAEARQVEECRRDEDHESSQSSMPPWSLRRCIAVRRRTAPRGSGTRSTVTSGVAPDVGRQQRRQMREVAAHRLGAPGMSRFSPKFGSVRTAFPPQCTAIPRIPCAGSYHNAGIVERKSSSCES